MLSIMIEQITIPYSEEQLQQWKNRDPSIVPSYMLLWNGKGVDHGYGFGEWLAERYFRDKGYYVFTNDFNLKTNNSKYKLYNNMINTLIDLDHINNFREAMNSTIQRGYSVENPDLFVFNLDTHFFAEVKKEKDILRDPQIRFFWLAKKYLGIDSKLIYLHDGHIQKNSQEMSYQFEI